MNKYGVKTEVKQILDRANNLASYALDDDIEGTLWESSELIVCIVDLLNKMYDGGPKTEDNVSGTIDEMISELKSLQKGIIR